MSKYKDGPLDFRGLKTVPLADRGGKVTLGHLGKPYKAGSGLLGLLDALPDQLAALNLRRTVEAMEKAREGGRAALWGMGGHVIKCGLGPVLADLMRRGFGTGFAMNGSAAIHDFELALAGHTSEDVEAVLPDGRFGSAEETGREFNRALALAAERGIGAGEALGVHLEALGAPNAEASLLMQAYRAGTPVTVHIAVGTDTPHAHPDAGGAAIGVATHTDFRLFCSLVRGLDAGGVFVNAGSAVVMPEVFLKAVSVVRNLGYPLGQFTTANFDFLQHYRPRVNVVERPHAGAGGQGYAITGHHEILIPLVAALLIDRSV